MSAKVGIVYGNMQFYMLYNVKFPNSKMMYNVKGSDLCTDIFKIITSNKIFFWKFCLFWILLCVSYITRYARIGHML